MQPDTQQPSLNATTVIH